MSTRVALEGAALVVVVLFGFGVGQAIVRGRRIDAVVASYAAELDAAR